MNILLAPDKFKGSLTADEVCSILERGIRSVAPDAQISSCPIADGGDGFADLLCEHLNGQWIECLAHDALGRPINARYALCGNTAVMEMSETAGIRLVPEELRDIWKANTYGTGEMVMHAIEMSGVERIIMGIGGSVTNDAGCGMISALGAKFRDDKGNVLVPSPIELTKCTVVDFSEFIQMPYVLVACDVENLLLGEDGAARIYGPQKGASEGDVEQLENWLDSLVQLTDGRKEAETPGAGAAGGLGFGLMKFCGAQLLPGFDLVAHETGLLDKIRASDIVITGEGKLDAQTLNGKGPAGVAKMAHDEGKQVVAIAGIVDPEARHLFDRTYALHDGIRPLEETILHGEQLLEACAAEMVLQLEGEG